MEITMKTWKVALLVAWLVMVGLMCVSCTGVSPEELASFKTKRAIVAEQHNKCATDPAACCAGLAEAERALDTVILACQD
jgi:hypothetical protein